jgi:hypothetical protein
MSETSPHQEVLVVPNIDSPDVKNFVETLLCQQRQSAQGGLPRAQYNDHKLVYINTTQNNYPPLQCWFNCIDYCLKKGGTPMFGWLIWQLDNPLAYVAQHHAIVDTGSCLIDVTNGGEHKQVLFVPDSQTPFRIDVNPMYLPANFYSEETQVYWEAFGRQNAQFYLQEMSAENSHLNLIALAKAKNLI